MQRVQFDRIILIAILLTVLILNSFSQSQASLIVPLSKFDSARPSLHGMMAVKKNGNWGFLNAENKIIIACRYKKVTDFFEERAIVLGKKYLMIDAKGKVIRVSSEIEFQRYLSLSHSNESASRSNINLGTSTLSSFIGSGCPPNLDFEFGDFTNWYCYTGIVDTLGVGGINNLTWAQTNPPTNSPTINQHRIITNTTPSAVDPYGLFPINPPDGSGYAVKLGNNQTNAKAEKIRYILTVPTNAQNYSITFQYAAVLENPEPGAQQHSNEQKPRMIAKFIDAATGNVLQCSDFLYVADDIISGFYNSPIDSNVKCKSWTPVFVNLSNYGGRTIYIEFITADCTLGAHFGYGYVDIGPCNQLIDVEYHCDSPHVTRLIAPPGYQYYNWWNSNFSSIIGTNQELSFNPGPPLNSIYYAEVIPYTGSVCRDTIKAQIVVTLPIADAGPDKNICLGGTTALGSPTISGYTYQWTPTIFLSNSQIANPISSTNIDTTYIVNVSDTNNCHNSDTVKVHALPSPFADFNISEPVKCLSSNPILFTNTSGPIGTPFTSAWYIDGSIYTTTNSSNIFMTPGNYDIKLVVSVPNGCADSMSKQVIINAVPNANFTPSTTIQCLNGNAFSFSNQSTISSGNITYIWNFGDGLNSALLSPTHSYTDTGNYIVELLAISDQGCRDSINTNVLVNFSTNINITTNQPLSICRGNSIQLTVNGSVSSQWTPATGLSCTNCSNPTANPSISTTYIVSGQNALGCPGKDTVNVLVYQPINLYGIGDSICAGQKANLFAIGASSYLWNPPTALSSTTIANPIATPTSTTTYRVIGSDAANCFSDTLFVTVTVGQNPSVDIGPDQTLSTGSTYTFSPIITNGPIQTWQWSPTTDLSCNDCPSPTASIKNDEEYILTVSNEFGCKASDTMLMHAFCENTQVYIPNAFTPDGDGINDIFMIRAKGIVRVNYFRIFNRWGELIFEKTNFAPNDPAYSWNGKIRGVWGPPDVFVYTAEVVCENGKPYKYKGNVSLIK